MEFYLVSSDSIYSPLLNRIQHRYGLAGLGYYWKVVSLLHLMGGSAPRISLLSMRGSGVRWSDAEAIIDNYGLFCLDEYGNYRLCGNNPQNGIHVPASKKSSSRAHVSPAGAPIGIPASLPTGTPTGAPADAPTSAATSAPTGNAQVPIERLEKKIRLEIEAEKNFYSFMHNECPHLLLLEEPMTFDQLKELRKRYSAEEIRSVLRDMENKADLTVRSCYKTALKWLKKR